MATQSRGAASKAARAAALNQLDDLGSDRSEFTTADMFSQIEKDAAAFIERVKENIQSADMVVTGKIEDLKLEVTDSGINILGNPYLIYQDKGVNGSEKKLYDTPFTYSDKMPPSNVFINWINTKNIQLRNEEDYDKNRGSKFADLSGDEKAIKSVAYLIARKIFREGFKPRNVFSKEIPKLVADVKKTVTTFSIDMITSSITDKYGNNVYNRTKK